MRAETLIPQYFQLSSILLKNNQSILMEMVSCHFKITTIHTKYYIDVHVHGVTLQTVHAVFKVSKPIDEIGWGQRYI